MTFTETLLLSILSGLAVWLDQASTKPGEIQFGLGGAVLVQKCPVVVVGALASLLTVSTSAGEPIEANRFRTPSTEAMTSSDGSLLYVALTKHGCFGWCPMYKVAIAGSGLVQYQGLKHVLIEGSQQSRVSQATVHELREAIDKSGFLSFDLPSRGCPDAEVIGLTVMMDGIEKSIQTSPHCYDSTDPLSGLSAGDFEGVDRLVRLLKDVDRLSGDVKWVGTPEERKQKKEAEREAFERARDSKIAALESQFETGDSMQRKHSAVQLMRYQTRVDEVLPYVLEALEDPDQGLRRDAARSLESMAQHRKLREWGLSISRREVVSALKRALDDPYKPVRDTAAQALGSMGPEASSAAAQLASMAREADPGVRRNALEALVKLGSSAGPAVPILVEIFPESQGSHRSSILRILGNAGPASAAVSLSVLIASLQDPDPSCRSQSARSLALLGSAASPSLAALTEVANSDPNDHVRRTAGKAITEIEADQ